MLDDGAFGRRGHRHPLSRGAHRPARRRACPTRCAGGTPPRWGSPVGGAGRHEPGAGAAAAGWRNVGRALHADELRDGAGTIEVRVPARGRAGRGRAGRRRVGECRRARRRRSAAWSTSSAADGLRRRYRVRLGRARCVRQRARGPVDLRLRRRGRRRRARRRGRRVPGAAARGRDQGAGGRGRRRRRGRRPRRARGDEDGAHPACATVRGRCGPSTAHPGSRSTSGDLLVELEPA